MGRKAREGSVAPMLVRTARSHDPSGARDLSHRATLRRIWIRAAARLPFKSADSTKMEGMILNRFLVDLT